MKRSNTPLAQGGCFCIQSLYMKHLVILGLLSSVLLPTIATAIETTSRSESKSLDVSLTSTSANPMRSVDLQPYNIPMPAECSQANVSCEESTVIKMTITKNWKITSVYPLTDKRLLPEEYAVYYPNMDTSQPITKNSDTEQIMLLQRALYDRGLLGVLPTGRYGALTELAVLHFQQIKGINKCVPGSIQADTTTVQELNAMKQRMADAAYLQNTSPAPFNVFQLCDDQLVRFNELVRFVDAASRGKIIQTLKPVDTNKVEIMVEGVTPNRSSINLDGFVKIER